MTAHLPRSGPHVVSRAHSRAEAKAASAGDRASRGIGSHAVFGTNGSSFAAVGREGGRPVAAVRPRGRIGVDIRLNGSGG